MARPQVVDEEDERNAYNILLGKPEGRSRYR
jgi:hypothetical protein